MTAVYDPSAFREVFETHFTYWSGFHRNTHRYARSQQYHDQQWRIRLRLASRKHHR